jgi:branched-chain amino acid transport system ATP-binding protein
MLEVSGLDVRYGAIQALRDISLDVREGEIVAVIGPNGAGKSTLMWALAGVVKSAAGTMRLGTATLADRAPEDIARLGMSLVPEDRHVFASLTVEENLRLGTTARPRDAGDVRTDRERLDEMFPALQRARDTPAGHLSGGQQQQLVIARALLARPRLLLLDEPSLGLDPANTALVFETLATLRADGTTILLVEQNAVQSTRLADRTYVLRTGTVVLHASRAEIAERTDLVHMYLGTA